MTLCMLRLAPPSQLPHPLSITQWIEVVKITSDIWLQLLPTSLEAWPKLQVPGVAYPPPTLTCTHQKSYNQSQLLH